MKKLIPIILALLMLSGCTALEEVVSAPAPTASPSAAPTATLTPSATAVSTPFPSSSPTPTPLSTTAPAARLVATAKLPAPETGSWYEWDIAGNYPANPGGYDFLYYVMAQDILIRTDSIGSSLTISRLDGTEIQVLDEEACRDINYCDGWIYYLKDDGVWRSQLNGNDQQRIISRSTDTLYDSLFVYDGRIYLIRYYQEYIETYHLDGSDHRNIDVPDIPDYGYFFSDGYLYYGANSAEAIEYGPDSSDIWRYDLSTGKAVKLVSAVYGWPIVRGGMVYYCMLDLERTDGEHTETVFGDETLWWEEYYSLYRNYMLYFKDKNCCGSYSGDTLCALDVDTGEEYTLFKTTDFLRAGIYVWEDSVFLYSGFSDDPMYRITFEDDQAYLWQLSGPLPADQP